MKKRLVLLTIILTVMVLVIGGTILGYSFSKAKPSYYQNGFFVQQGVMGDYAERNLYKTL